MMFGYTAAKIALMEHEERIRKMAPILDYDDRLKYTGPGWLPKHIGGLLRAAGNGLASLYRRAKHGRETVIEVPLTRQEQGEVPG